jgi:predicted ribosome quality control (RQC) complex YloA/Tae2 family protein
MKSEYYNDTKIIIGENAKDNWDIIDFESENIWLHLNSFPSCHVVIEDNSPSEDVLNYAANLCKQHTKYRNLKNLKICFTKCNNLVKGEDVGSVSYKSKRQVNYLII